MIRLIASDLDGTLLSGHESIHPDNLAAIRRAAAQGVRFVAASGRSVASCALLLRDHGLMDAMIIGVNGCQTVQRPFGRTLSLQYMPEGTARAAIDLFARYRLDGCLYTQSSIVYTTPRMIPGQTCGMQRSFAERMAQAGVRVEAGPEAIARALGEGPMKAYCIYHAGQEADFAAAREAAGRIPGAAVTSSWHDNFEVMPQGVDKGTALKALCEGLGIAREEVIAFGDSDNDLPMLRWAGHAYAMAGAQQVVLKEIKNVTDRCDAGGVARALAENGVGRVS